MAVRTKDQLRQQVTDRIEDATPTSPRPTSAADVRSVMTDMVDSFATEVDDGGFRETDVGPALTNPTAQWDEYVMTEALEAAALYQFVCTHDSETTRLTRTTFVKGSDLIGLPVQANATYDDSDDNVRAVLIPRLQAAGAIQIHVGMKDESNNELYLHFNDLQYQVVRMVKLTAVGAKGDPGTGSSSSMAPTCRP